jgi:hypothetical protein
MTVPIFYLNACAYHIFRFSVNRLCMCSTIKTSSLGTHWKNAQVGLQQLEKSNVEEVDNVIKYVTYKVINDCNLSNFINVH